MSQIDDCEQIELNFQMNKIENGQEIEIGINDSNSNEEDSENSDSSAFNLYQVLVERHDLYSADPNDDNSSDEEEKFSSAED